MWVPIGTPGNKDWMHLTIDGSRFVGESNVLHNKSPPLWGDELNPA